MMRFIKKIIGYVDKKEDTPLVEKIEDKNMDMKFLIAVA